MKQIELYECPPIFHSMHYFELARELGEKLKKDKNILEKNESNENKITYFKNLLMYHLLLVEGTIINSEIAKKNLVYQKDGWFIWLQIMNFAPAILCKDNDELFTYWFDKYFDSNFPEIENNIYYNQVISNYKQGNYYACVCCLFPLIENIEKQISKFDGTEIFHIKKELSNTHIPKKQKCREYFEEFEKNMNIFLKDNIYNSSTESESEPKIICRNRILHGIFTRDINKTDCLKLLCIYRSMYNFNGWLNSLREINILGNYIEKQETESKKNS